MASKKTERARIVSWYGELTIHERCDEIVLSRRGHRDGSNTLNANGANGRISRIAPRMVKDCVTIESDSFNRPIRVQVVGVVLDLRRRP